MWRKYKYNVFFAIRLLFAEISDIRNWLLLIILRMEII